MHFCFLLITNDNDQIYFPTLLGKPVLEQEKIELLWWRIIYTTKFIDSTHKIHCSQFPI